MVVGDIVDRLQIRRLLQGFARRVSIRFGLSQLGLHVDHAGFQHRKNGTVISQIFKRTRSADLHGTRKVLGNRCVQLVVKTVHDAVVVGIGAEIGDVLVRHDGNVQARLVDHPRFQKRDEGAALLRLAVDAPASGECEDKSSRKRKRTAARPERRTWEHCIHSSHIRRSHEYPFFQQAPCW